MDDADLAVINADWVIVSHVDPHTALLKETAGTNYTNLMVVREGDQNRPELQKFLNLYQAPDVEAFIKEEFKGVIEAQW
jgi:D-methionine transport system substrate-binding protein